MGSPVRRVSSSIPIGPCAASAPLEGSELALAKWDSPAAVRQIVGFPGGESGTLRGTRGVLEGYSRGTRGLLRETTFIRIAAGAGVEAIVRIATATGLTHAGTTCAYVPRLIFPLKRSDSHLGVRNPTKAQRLPLRRTDSHLRRAGTAARTTASRASRSSINTPCGRPAVPARTRAHFAPHAHTRARARARAHEHPQKHTNAHARAHTHKHTRTHTHSHSHSPTLPHTRAHTQTRTHTHTHAHTHTRTHTDKCTHTHLHTHTHRHTQHTHTSHTHTRTRTRTHTHTHIHAAGGERPQQLVLRQHPRQRRRGQGRRTHLVAVRTSRPGAALDSTAKHGIALHCTAVQCTSRHGAALLSTPFAALPPSLAHARAPHASPYVQVRVGVWACGRVRVGELHGKVVSGARDSARGCRCAGNLAKAAMVRPPCPSFPCPEPSVYTL